MKRHNRAVSLPLRVAQAIALAPSIDRALDVMRQRRKSQFKAGSMTPSAFYAWQKRGAKIA